MLPFSKLIYRLNAIPISISIGFVMEFYNSLSTYICIYTQHEHEYYVYICIYMKEQRLKNFFNLK